VITAKGVFHRSDRAKQAILFIVDAGCEIERCGRTRRAATAEVDAPESVNLDGHIVGV